MPTRGKTVDTIDFHIPGTGPFTISPTSALPTITHPVLIDGYSQPDSSPNTHDRQRQRRHLDPAQRSERWLLGRPGDHRRQEHRSRTGDQPIREGRNSPLQRRQRRRHGKLPGHRPHGDDRPTQLRCRHSGRRLEQRRHRRDNCRRAKHRFGQHKSEHLHHRWLRLPPWSRAISSD